MLTPPARIQVSDPVVQRALDSLVDTLRRVLLCPFLDGVLVANVSVSSSGYTNVPHTLGRKPRGYIVVQNSNATMLVEDETQRTAAFLSLKSGSGSLTTDIWVY